MVILTIINALAEKGELLMRKIQLLVFVLMIYILNVKFVEKNTPYDTPLPKFFAKLFFKKAEKGQKICQQNIYT